MQHLENSAWHMGCQPPTLTTAQGIVTLPTSFSGGQWHSAPGRRGTQGAINCFPAKLAAMLAGPGTFRLSYPSPPTQ